MRGEGLGPTAKLAECTLLRSVSSLEAWGDLEIVEKNMETTIMGLFWVKGLGLRAGVV